jgi:hypothetical protein
MFHHSGKRKCWVCTNLGSTFFGGGAEAQGGQGARERGGRGPRDPGAGVGSLGAWRRGRGRLGPSGPKDGSGVAWGPGDPGAPGLEKTKDTNPTLAKRMIHACPTLGNHSLPNLFNFPKVQFLATKKSKKSTTQERRLRHTQPNKKAPAAQKAPATHTIPN